ncbi:DUF7282 domain-containing protein [Halorientalis regularis]|uniref:PGF-CTERM protein/surface glycoprotein n=1 Tax=Halorientalis regularis TaxID=660518 RepID=A0A1G7LS39_9EURY|nr:BGTF surface domain-containing protein [Halorientalis regularis]SDF52368.1 PGF-CTERM protein/surface glycoprotein [Halorientalis regularis]
MTGTRDKIRSLFLATLMVTSVFAGFIAFSGTAAAATNAQFGTSGVDDPSGTPAAGSTDTLHAEVDLESDDSFQQVQISFPSFGDAFSNLDDSDVTIFIDGLDNVEDGSGTFNNNNDVTVEQVSNGGSTITVQAASSFSSSDLDVGDQVTVQLATNVQFPSDGDYGGTVDINPQSSGRTASGLLTVGSGGIAAQEDTNPTERQNDQYDETLTSGDTYWQGQRLVIKKTDLANQQVDIRETESADGGGERIPSGSLVQEVSLDSNGEAIISTENLEGTYAITDGQGNNNVIHFDNDGIAGNSDYSAAGGDEFDSDGTVDTSQVASGGEINTVVQAASFSVTSQNVNVGFQSDSSAQEEIYLEADSARTGYQLLVTADGLDDSEITQVFDDEFEDGDDDNSLTGIKDASDLNGVSGDGVLFNGTSSDSNITANFSDIDVGDYEFEFEVTDTGVTDASTVTVEEEEDVEATILRGGVSTAAQGDYAVIPIRLEETDTATVNLGFNDVNFNATFDIEDGNDDNIVTVNVNTYLAGRNDDLPSYLNSFVQTSGGVNFNTLASGTEAERNTRANLSLTYAVTADDNEDEVSVTGMRPLGQDGNLPDAGIDGPMEPAQYDVNVTKDGSELDVGTVQIVEPQVSGITSWTMPGDAFSDVDEDEPAEIYEFANAGELTTDNSIAEDDVLVYQVQSTSMFGALKIVEDQTSDDFAEAFNTITNYDESGDYKFSVVQTEGTTAANQQEKELLLGATTGNGMKVVPDERNSSVFVVVDEANAQLIRQDLSDSVPSPSAASLGMVDGEDYVANWTTFEDSDIGDETQTVTDEAAIVEQSIDFDTDQGDVIRVAAAQGQVISGSTSVAPGTELNIRLRSTGDSPFLEDPTAIVSGNGTFSTTVDLSDRAQNASFVANAQGFDDDYDTPGVIGSAPTAQVTFDDQEVSDGTVEVTGTMSEGGFIAIHSGSASGEIIGNSEYLSPGEFTTEVEISPLSGNTTLVAMAHLDTNGNEAFDFAGSGTADGPYVLNGSAVIDSATISPETTDTPDTDTPDMDTDTPEPETDAPATEEPAETTTQTGPGFTAVLALVALVAAALLAVRRRD